MKVVFMGSPDFAVPALRSVAASHEVVLVVTQPDKRAGRGRKMSAPAVKEAALELGLPIHQPSSARTPEFLERVQEAGAEVAVVVAYGKILPIAVLEAFPKGCLNIHGSLLPAYRGASPIQRAIMDGLSSTGVTIMRLDEGMDTGPMLTKGSLEIRDDDTVTTLGTRMSALGAELVARTLGAVEDGSVHEEPQGDDGVSYAPMLSKSDGELDWTADARAVSCHIRGVDPWPAAFSTLGEDRIRLFSPMVGQQGGEPGQILELSSDGVVVACGRGSVTIAEVQAPGKKRMKATDYSRGRSLVGRRFVSSKTE